MAIELPTRYVKALESRYQAKIDEGIAIVDLYLSRSAGVGDHPNILDVLDNHLEIVETNTAKLNLLKSVFQPETENN
tara:strand:+ start:1925 stop:2155 length:231 start_codon:yes stop_codon:yes gene_type:complete